MIEQIMLDLDGPLLDGKYRHYQCYADILRAHGYVPLEIETYWSMKRNRVDRCQQLAASQADELYERFLHCWLERIERKDYLTLDRLQPGVLTKLRQWRSAGVALTLVTLRNHEENLRWQLDEFGLAPLLDHIVAVGTSAGAEGKGEAAGRYLSGDAPETIVWIGDTEIDVAAARALGVRVCVVGCGLRTSDYLATLSPDYLCEDLHGINLSEM